MGADLIATWFWTDGGEPDVEGAKQVLADLDDETFLDGYDEATGGLDEFRSAQALSDARDEVQGWLDEIAAFSKTRDTLVIDSPRGDRLYLAGGTSFGDDPGPTYTALAGIACFPDVIAALAKRPDRQKTINED